MLMSLSRSVNLKELRYLMDEPLGRIDPTLKKNIKMFILENIPEDATIIMATHLLTLIGNSWEEHVIDKSAWIGKEYEFAKDNQYSLFTVCDSLPDDSMSLEYNWAEFKKGTKFTLLDIDSDNYMFLISLEDGRKGVLSFYLSD